MDIICEAFDKMEVNLKPSDFKKEWSHIEIAGVKSLLTELLTEEGLINHEDSTDESNASEFFGFALNSGYYDEALCLTCTQKGITIDGNEINCFLIRNNNQLIAHCFDSDDKDIFYEVR